jgi:uracil-DNA glycosylase
LDKVIYVGSAPGNHPPDKVIALGNLVAKYFENRKIEHLKVPHPSGLNRMWNDPELEPKVIEEIRGFTNSQNCGIMEAI